MKTFEQYLGDIHADKYAGIDDDMPGAFDTWMAELDVQEVMDYAEDWMKAERVEEFIRGVKHGMQVAQDAYTMITAIK